MAARGKKPDDEVKASQRAERLDLYRMAVDEYRFQVNLNWDRSKYLLGFNTVIIGVGTGLVKLGGSAGHFLVAGVFLLGFVSAMLSCFAIGVQQGYYKQARDRMVRLGGILGLDDAAVATTPGARGARAGLRGPLGKVQTILYTLLFVCMLVNLSGVVYVTTQGNLTSPTQSPQPARPTPSPSSGQHRP